MRFERSYRGQDAFKSALGPYDALGRSTQESVFGVANAAALRTVGGVGYDPIGRRTGWTEDRAAFNMSYAALQSTTSGPGNLSMRFPLGGLEER